VTFLGRVPRAEIERLYGTHDAFCFPSFREGVELYASQAILRVFPQDSNILDATGDDSVLKTFDSLMKAETTYVPSIPVMERAAATLRTAHPDLAAELKATDLAGSIEIRRNDSPIILSTKSRDAAFVSAKLGAFAAFAALGLGLSERRLRFAETLAPVAHLLPVVQPRRRRTPPGRGRGDERPRRHLREGEEGPADSGRSRTGRTSASRT
jgi:hypothetical protein